MLAAHRCQRRLTASNVTAHSAANVHRQTGTFRSGWTAADKENQRARQRHQQAHAPVVRPEGSQDQPGQCPRDRTPERAIDGAFRRWPEQPFE